MRMKERKRTFSKRNVTFCIKHKNTNLSGSDCPKIGYLKKMIMLQMRDNGDGCCGQIKMKQAKL